MKKCENIRKYEPYQLLTDAVKGMKLLSNFELDGKEWLVMQCCKKASQACFPCGAIVCEECRPEHKDCDTSVLSTM
jgi:hypothetical protein